MLIQWHIFACLSLYIWIKDRIHVLLSTLLMYVLFRCNKWSSECFKRVWLHGRISLPSSMHSGKSGDFCPPTHSPLKMTVSWLLAWNIQSFSFSRLYLALFLSNRMLEPAIVFVAGFLPSLGSKNLFQNVMIHFQMAVWMGQHWGFQPEYPHTR